MQTEIFERCNAIEECYEFMLAYAAKGLPGETITGSTSQIREFLTRAADAIRGVADSFATAIHGEDLQPAEKYQAFLAVLDRNSQEALASIELVLAQPSISSQLIDNLNASIHLRALLTDLFLIDEVLKTCAQ